MLRLTYFLRWASGTVMLSTNDSALSHCKVDRWRRYTVDRPGRRSMHRRDDTAQNERVEQFIEVYMSDAAARSIYISVGSVEHD